MEGREFVHLLEMFRVAVAVDFLKTKNTSTLSTVKI
jgi:hypothetical protein